jgi:hypothetical protein
LRLNWAAFLFLALLGWLSLAVVVGVLVGHGIALGAADTD